MSIYLITGKTSVGKTTFFKNLVTNKKIKGKVYYNTVELSDFLVPKFPKVPDNWKDLKNVTICFDSVEFENINDELSNIDELNIDLILLGEDPSLLNEDVARRVDKHIHLAKGLPMKNKKSFSKDTLSVLVFEYNCYKKIPDVDSATIEQIELSLS